MNLFLTLLKIEKLNGQHLRSLSTEVTHQNQMCGHLVSICIIVCSFEFPYFHLFFKAV
jgi:hypothetical protein